MMIATCLISEVRSALRFASRIVSIMTSRTGEGQAVYTVLTCHVALTRTAEHAVSNASEPIRFTIGDLK